MSEASEGEGALPRFRAPRRGPSSQPSPRTRGEGGASVSHRHVTVVDIQLKERTELTFNRVGPEQRDSILQAGLALQQAGVIPANVDVKQTLNDLVDDRYVGA